MANQRGWAATSWAGTGTSTVDRQDGHWTRSPAEAGPSSRRGCPHLSQKKVNGSVARARGWVRHRTGFHR
jgi:hypothetical protein